MSAGGAPADLLSRTGSTEEGRPGRTGGDTQGRARPKSMRTLSLAAAALLAVALPVAPPARTENLVVVTLDGVRWQDVFYGVDPSLAMAYGLRAEEVVPGAALMPELHALAAAGRAYGMDVPMRAVDPPVSLPGYLAIFAGGDPWCDSNDCERTTARTFLDDARERLATRAEDVAVFASWERYDLAATSAPGRIVVSVGRHGGATRGKVAGDAGRVLAGAADDACEDVDLCGAAGAPRRQPICLSAPAACNADDYRPDAATGAAALRYLEAEWPRVLVVGLGDTDEYGHADDLREYLRAMRSADAFLGELRGVLARSGTYGERTTVIVTTDHGRGGSFAYHGRREPESARVWMVAWGGAFAPSGPVERLSAIPSLARSLLGL